MNTQVSWMLELEVRAGKAEELRALMAEMVAAARENEPGTLDYEWSVSADGKQLHIFERYTDSAAVMAHLATFGSRFAERFLGALQPTRFVVYGSPSAEARKALAGLSPIFMEPAAGFSR